MWSAITTAGVVTTAVGREIWVSNADGRALIVLVGQFLFGDDGTIMLASPVFSPDGHRIAYQRNAQKPVWPLRIWISQTAGGPPVPLLPPSIEGYHSAPTWSPDGEWIAYADWTDRQWRLAKVRVGDERPIILRSDGVANATPEWSPTGKWITWETDRGFILVSPDGTGERVLSTTIGSLTPGRTTDAHLRHSGNRRSAALARLADADSGRCTRRRPWTIAARQQTR